MSVARNTLAYWASQLANLAISMVSTLIVTHWLPKEARGLLVGVILANTLAISFTNLGVQAIAMYFVGREPDRLAYHHTLIVILVLAISLVDFGVAIAGGELLRNHLPNQVQEISWRYAAIAIGILPFSLYYFAAQGILAGLGRVRQLSFVLFCYSVIANGLNIGIALVIQRGPGLAETLIVVWAVGQVLLSLVFYRFVRSAGKIWMRLDFPEIIRGLRTMLSYGFRAFVGSFASTLINRNDQVFIASAYGKAGLGVYNLSAKFAELIYQPSAAFENAGFARVASGNRRDAAGLVQDLFRMNFLIGVCGLIGLALVGGPFIKHYLGEYQDAVVPLLILLPGTLFLSGTRMFALYFSGQLGKPQIPSMISWAAALIDTGLLWVVVVRHDAGLSGAAAVTTGCYAFMFLSSLLIFANLTKLRNPVLYFIPQARDFARISTLLKGIRERRGI